MYENINKYIKEGNNLEIFSSQTAVRVVRIENEEGVLVAYAENSYLKRVLMTAEELCLNGENDNKDRFLSGGLNTDSKLDELVVHNNKILISKSKKRYTEPRGERLGEYVRVPAVELVIESFGEEILKLVGTSVEDVINRAEIEAEYILNSGINAVK